MKVHHVICALPLGKEWGLRFVLKNGGKLLIAVLPTYPPVILLGAVWLMPRTVTILSHDVVHSAKFIEGIALC